MSANCKRKIKRENGTEKSQTKTTKKTQPKKYLLGQFANDKRATGKRHDETRVF